VRKLRWVGIILLVILIPSSLAYALAVQFDYYGFPYFNPAPQRQILPFYLDYPPNSASPIAVRQVSDPPAGNETCVLLSIKMEWNGTLAQGTPIKFLYSGILPVSQYCKEYLQEVQFGFYGDYPVGAPISQNELDFGGTLWGIFWGRANLTSTSPFQSANQTVYFPASGQYSPTVILDFMNFTNPQKPSLGESQYTYTDRILPVASSLDVQNAKNSKIQTVLTWAILAFAYLEGVSITVELTKEKKTRSDPSNPQYTTSNAKPEGPNKAP
jgi:hypothetical protein